ncbi:MAG: PTS sugar transporter subunit IIB [Deltaproteobacteria bacterium]|nr:PTS sugar transporter subunit IIB [Deltaproteobacteria bacterium]
MKKILVACGTGIATSTVVAKKLEELLHARGIAVSVDQCKASEVAAKAPGFDLIVATTQVADVPGVPALRTLSFLTGIGIDADMARITKILTES